MDCKIRAQSHLSKKDTVVENLQYPVPTISADPEETGFPLTTTSIEQIAVPSLHPALHQMLQKSKSTNFCL